MAELTRLAITADPGDRADVTSAQLLSKLFGWSFAAGLVSRSAVLISTLAAARVLGPMRFGQYIGFYALSGIAASIWDLGVATLLTREFAGSRLSVRSALGQCFELRMITFPAWLITFGAGVGIMAQSEVGRWGILWFASSSILFGIHAIPLAMLRGQLQFKLSETALACGRGVTSVISVAALPIFGKSNISIFAFAVLTGECFTLCIATVFLIRTARTINFVKGEYPPLSLRAAAPFAANMILSTVYNRLDVVIVGALASLRELMLYAPASRIQDALYLFPITVDSVAYAVISRTWNSPHQRVRATEQIRRLTVAGFSICFLISLFGCIFMPQILVLGLGSEFLKATAPARILIWFMPIAALSAPLIGRLNGSGHQAEATKTYAIAFTTAVSMHLLLDWRWGAIGGAIASLSRDPLVLIAALHFTRRAGISDALNRSQTVV